MDIGSGAGFPGIPLKIAFPEMALSLLEASQKKAAFLHSLLGVLGLEKVNIYNQRLEMFRSEWGGRPLFDRILSRGVGMKGAVKDRWADLIKSNGVMVFYGGREAALERDRAFSVERVTVQIPGADRLRTLYLVRKSRASSTV